MRIWYYRAILLKPKTMKKPNIQNLLSVTAIVVSVLALGLNVGGVHPLGAAVTSVAGNDNLLLNGQFKATDYGSGTFDSATGVGNFFNTRWRAKHVFGSSSATFQQIDDLEGGTRITLNNSANEEYFYVRQSIPNVMQFSGKSFTVRADVADADAGLKFDFYVNARWNNSDWVSVLDTAQSDLTAGTHTATFSVPDLSPYSSYTENNNGGLEVAFRINSPNPQSGAVVELDSLALFEGSNLSESPIGDYTRERATLNSYYERGRYTTGVVGLDTSGGQKRATFYMTTHKVRGTSYDLTFWDAVGNEGKVSTYTQSGARKDNVAPDSVRHSTNGMIFVFYDSDIAGIGLSWVADSEI